MKLSKETLLNLSYYVFLDDDENWKNYEYLGFLIGKVRQKIEAFL